MNEEDSISALLAEINPPEKDTAGEVLLRLHSRKHSLQWKIRPLAATVLAVLLLCGTAIALKVTGTVDLHPSDELILDKTPCLFRADWVPERQIPVSDELRIWMEPYLQEMPTEQTDEPTAFVLMDNPDLLEPLLENADLYRSLLTDKAEETRLLILDDGSIKYVSILQLLNDYSGKAHISSVNLNIVYGDGTEEPGEIAGLAAGTEQGDTERGEMGKYDSPVSGASASYCFTYTKTESEYVQLSAWVPNGAALWEFHICGADEDAQMALMQELVDSLER